jgi:hypothetical protein
MNAYSQWFFSVGWLYISVLSLWLGWTFGLKFLWVPVTVGLFAVLARAGGAA